MLATKSGPVLMTFLHSSQNKYLLLAFFSTAKNSFLKVGLVDINSMRFVQMGFCGIFGQQVDAIDYYTTRIEQLTQEVS